MNQLQPFWKRSRTSGDGRASTKSLKPCWSRNILEQLVAKLNVVNLIATAELKQRVDLESLSRVSGFRYDPAVYRCAYFNDEVTRGKVSIFGTGKMISVATRRVE